MLTMWWESRRKGLMFLAREKSRLSFLSRFHARPADADRSSQARQTNMCDRTYFYYRQSLVYCCEHVRFHSIADYDEDEHRAKNCRFDELWRMPKCLSSVQSVINNDKLLTFENISFLYYIQTSFEEFS